MAFKSHLNRAAVDNSIQAGTYVWITQVFRLAIKGNDDGVVPLKDVTELAHLSLLNPLLKTHTIFISTFASGQPTCKVLYMVFEQQAKKELIQ